MIVGMLSDAHGNVEGFRRGVEVLRALGATRICFLGDAVGYLPGSAVVEAIVDEGVEPLAGNHEAMLLDADPTNRDDVLQLDATRRELGADGLAAVASWPTRRTIDTAVGPVLLVHDHPLGDGSYVYPDSDLDALGPQPWTAVCMGHTHRAFIGQSRTTTFVNVGSCGLPRDDGRLGAVATLDTDTASVHIVRYDLREATEQALARVGPVHAVVSTTMRRREVPHESARDTFGGTTMGRDDA